MAAVAIYAAKGVAAPLHRVAPSAAMRTTSHPRAALGLGVVDDLALAAAPHGARKGRHLVGGAGNPHLCGEGAALKGYTDGLGGLALTVFQPKDPRHAVPVRQQIGFYLFQCPHPLADSGTVTTCPAGPRCDSRSKTCRSGSALCSAPGRTRPTGAPSSSRAPAWKTRLGPGHSAGRRGTPRRRAARWPSSEGRTSSPERKDAPRGGPALHWRRCRRPHGGNENAARCGAAHFGNRPSPPRAPPIKKIPRASRLPGVPGSNPGAWQQGPRVRILRGLSHCN